MKKLSKNYRSFKLLIFNQRSIKIDERGSGVVPYQAHNLVAAVQFGSPQQVKFMKWSHKEEEKLKRLYSPITLRKRCFKIL